LENIRTSLDSSWYLSETITCAILVNPSSAFSLFLFILFSYLIFFNYIMYLLFSNILMRTNDRHGCLNCFFSLKGLNKYNVSCSYIIYIGDWVVFEESEEGVNIKIIYDRHL
jgi:hypothetical protein